MKQYILIVGIVGLLFVLFFGAFGINPIGSTSNPVIDVEKEIPADERQPEIVVDPIKTCADLNCKSGYYCTIKDQTPYCVQKEDLSPAPPSRTLEQTGEWIVEVLDWDCGWSLFGTCTPILRSPGSPIFVYGYVIVPYSGEYILETGFEALATGTLSMFTATKSACDSNPYYSGVRKYLEAGKKYYFEFMVKQPAYEGTYNQYAAIFSGCNSEGGEFIRGKWRAVSIK